MIRFSFDVSNFSSRLTKSNGGKRHYGHVLLLATVLSWGSGIKKNGKVSKEREKNRRVRSELGRLVPPLPVERPVMSYERSGAKLMARKKKKR